MPDPASDQPSPRAWSRHRRPPWWPADEPWPPRGPWGGGRRRMQRRFMGRFFGFAALVFFFGITGCTVAFWLSALAAGLVDLPESARAIARGLSILALVVGAGGILFTVRTFRSLTSGVAGFLEAVGRVADGDYAARVPEHGPREVRALARAFNRMAARLEANDTQRRSLLADVTHELRTPLTVMQGNLEGVLDGVYPADPAHLAPILDSTRMLSRLIDDLRTLAQVETGALALHREPTDLAVLAGEAVAALRPRAEAAGVRLALEAAGDLPLLAVDPVRLREVLDNLLANALRYTPAGGAVTLSAAPGPEGGVALTVTDTGAGIAAEALPHIFDRFYKSPDSHGSGLGLAIARNLVAAHGGTLTAESTAGQGTTMRVVLPGEE